jgi:hypothetical protein
MARLICRPPTDHWPSAQEAREHQIAAWLISARVDPHGRLELGTAGDWPADLPFCLEWQLSHPLSPGQEREAAQLFRPWLADPLQLRWRGERPLWIDAPERLSNPHWAYRQLRLTLGGDVVVWGRGPAAHALGGRYEQPLQEWPCRRVNGCQHDYESYLFHAHHRGAGNGVSVPAVQPWTAALEHSHSNLRQRHYNEWLAMARAWADLRHGPGEEPLVLVEAWEGHQRWWAPPPAQPATARWATPQQIRKPLTGNGCSDPRPALVVHGFHLDQLRKLLSAWPSPGATPMALYLSTPPEGAEQASQLAAELGWAAAEVVAVENRGRDMGPFVLDLLPRVLANGHPWLLKLHTKRSSHLEAGEAWARHLREHLAGPKACQGFGERFAAHPDLGLLAAPGTLLPSSISLDCNLMHLRWLLEALAIPSHWWLEQPCAAGSMYAVRSQALEPLLGLQLSRDQFEAEQGQRDGTLAHALERLVAALVIRQGLQVCELSGNAQAVPPFGYGWAAPA